MLFFQVHLAWLNKFPQTIKGMKMTKIWIVLWYSHFEKRQYQAAVLSTKRLIAQSFLAGQLGWCLELFGNLNFQLKRFQLNV